MPCLSYPSKYVKKEVHDGIRTLLRSQPPAKTERPATRSLLRVFTDGVVISVLNPKIAVFFLAFLPQFADPNRGPIPQQILFLGLIYVALALVTDGAYAILAGRIRQWLDRIANRTPLPRIASGVVYIGLGIGTAVVDRHS